MNKSVLVLKDICKSYSQGVTIIEILKNINLEVLQGQLIGILGMSGSGKSTLLHIAGLLDETDSGSVQINPINNDLHNNYVSRVFGKKSAPKNLLRLHHIGFVYQSHHLLKDLTAIENVMLPRLIAGAERQQMYEDAKSLLAKLNLMDKINHMPGELSGGQQQRVAIARSLINKPSLLLADEPTGDLDSVTAHEVFELFVNIAKYHNTAILMVTHNHEIAQQMHKVYELKHGCLH